MEDDNPQKAIFAAQIKEGISP
jgi:hypothetical protein